MERFGANEGRIIFGCTKEIRSILGDMMNLLLLMKSRCVDVNIQIIFDVDDRSNVVYNLSL